MDAIKNHVRRLNEQSTVLESCKKSMRVHFLLNIFVLNWSDPSRLVNWRSFLTQRHTSLHYLTPDRRLDFRRKSPDLPSLLRRNL